jgi:hypothetical protein
MSGRMSEKPIRQTPSYTIVSDIDEYYSSESTAKEPIGRC